MNRYLLDADIFIQAKNLHYGFDFCPAFWDWLVAMNRVKKVASINHIKNELLAGDDELSDWAKKQGNTFFLSPDENIQPALRDVSQWTQQQDYVSAAVSKFLNAGDYHLVAYAKAYSWIIVTHEKAQNRSGKIKIPNACAGLGIDCVNSPEMLRKEDARFVLESFQ